MNIRFRIVILLASIFAGVLPLAHGQTLAEVLSAVQRRRQLQADAVDVTNGLLDQLDAAGVPTAYYYGPRGTKPPLYDWGLGVDYPTDAQVNSLPIGTQIALLKQAWRQAYSNVYIDRLGGPISIENFYTAVRFLASIVRKDNKLAWPILGHMSYYHYYSDKIQNLPSPPLSLSDADYDDQPDELVAGGSLQGNQHPNGIDIGLYGFFDQYLDDQDNLKTDYRWVGDISYFAGVTANAPASFPGHLQIYQSGTYGVNAGGGLSLPAQCKGDGTPDAAYEPGEILFTDSGTIAKGGTSANLGDLDSAFSDLSTPYFPGSWFDQPAVSPNPHKGPFYMPQYKNQSNQFTLNGYFDWVYGMTIFTFSAYFLPDYGQEFASQAQPPPEELQPLQIRPDFVNGRLVVRLASEPENDCELEWIPNSYDSQHHVSTGSSLSSRHALMVQGAGQWDAVYSGSSNDREPVITWPGDSQTSYKRWAGFGYYVNEWWQPVLTQLKANTYGLNITQQGQYTYKIEFYRSSQMGAKSITTGRYTPTGSAIATWTVQNPSNDDADIGHLTITTDDATYQASMVQSTANDGSSSTQWSLTETSKSSSSLLYSVTATLTGLKLVQQVGFDGQAAPIKTTTTYSAIFYPDGPAYPATITEESADGVRSTTYTYDLESDDYNYNRSYAL